MGENMALQPKTIDDFCRLCATESQSGVVIYSTEGENLCLEEKIINCLRIEVSRDDMLPKKVCQSCSSLLDDYHRFSERATQVQQTLGFLLGLHIRHIQEQEELCLLQANVKMESNLIKNELDDLMIHSNSLPIENEKFDLSVGRQDLIISEEDYQNRQLHRRKMLDDPVDKRQLLLLDEDEYSNVSALGEAISSNDNTARQIHRRKMSQPKKAAAPEKIQNEPILADMDGIECLIGETNGNHDDFKSEEFNENDLFQDLDDEENNDENVELNNKDDGEEEQVEKEWRKHWGITCDHCQSVFPNRTLFEKHYRLSYNKKPVYTCSFCKKSMDKYSTYRSHCYRHIYEGRFKCKYCDKKFCMKSMLQVHVLSRHGPVRPFICEECGIGFVTQSRLNSHQKKHSTQAKEEFRCTECDKILQTRGGLAAHMTVHKLGRRFMCHLCGKTFTQKINMQQHVKHHKGERPYSCEDCGKSFAEKSHLNRHKSFHTLDRPFQCPVCKKMYKTERCLKVHSQVHLNTRPYICSYCGKGFLSSTKLKQHYNCHTGERPFACKYCERTFTNYPNWLKHTRRRHKVDHKTGLSLKEESQPQNVVPADQVPEPIELPDSGIEFIEIPDVEVKEDGRDSVQSQHSLMNAQSSHLVTQSIISQFQAAQDAANSHFQMHMVPDLVSSQHVYPDHVMTHHHHMMSL